MMMDDMFKAFRYYWG